MWAQQHEFGGFDAELWRGSANNDATAAADWVGHGDNDGIVVPANLDADSTDHGLRQSDDDGDQYQYWDDDGDQY
jgi:hypothetical protein